MMIVVKYQDAAMGVKGMVGFEVLGRGRGDRSGDGLRGKC